ncbi:hydroxymethylbilane synthase [Flavonifractor sp. HCP28S3_F3]|uniref:hydroxymethylbilane synthase n=1 Tax=Flavonifractor sp. HCP28S3_F3 TaxID=3438939 RepID=UPI003F8A9801
MKTIRVGSRESKLAVIQSELVMDAIRASHPDVTLELVTMKTTGDKILDRTLDKIGGKGLFVKELDAALLDGRADLTVHSCKDLPMEENPAIPLAGFSKREDPRDVLVLPEGVTELDSTKPIGCASARRAVQLKELFPGMEIAPVRGNVLTRLRKLDEGQFSALVLAAAGLKRLGLEGRITRYFTVEEMIPAAGQGILALQSRAGEDLSYLDQVLDEAGTLCARAERAFVRRLDGGCSSPIAAHAVLSDGEITITGLYVDEEGTAIRRTTTGPRNQGEDLARRLADEIKEACPCLEK